MDTDSTSMDMDMNMDNDNSMGGRDMGNQNRRPNHQSQFKVFVGNLPYSISEATLKQVFMDAGDFKDEDITEVIILKERDAHDPSRPPRSRGIGFVGFTSKDLMQQAIERVNGTEVEYEVRGEMMKRPIFVNEARPYVPKEDRMGGR